MDKNVTPLISVIMSVYNAETYLKEAIESVLNQTFVDFEFLIIDDASTDKSVEVIKSFKDERIVLLHNPVNSGVAYGCNRAIELARGKYIARMDADDICLPDRFSRQFEYMEQHLDILVLGSMYEIIGTKTISKGLPIASDQVKLFCLLNSPVANSTSLIRRSVFDLYNLKYDRTFEPSEDYDLWSRILDFGKIENLPNLLLLYRVHAQQISVYKRKKQIEMADQVRLRQLEKLIDLNGDMYDSAFVIKTLSHQLLNITSGDLVKINVLLKDLQAANAGKKNYNDLLFSKFLNEIWWHHVLKLKKYELRYLIPLLKSPLNSKPASLLFRLKFILKSILGWEAKQKSTL